MYNVQRAAADFFGINTDRRAAADTIKSTHSSRPICHGCIIRCLQFFYTMTSLATLSLPGRDVVLFGGLRLLTFPRGFPHKSQLASTPFQHPPPIVALCTHRVEIIDILWFKVNDERETETQTQREGEKETGMEEGRDAEKHTEKERENILSIYGIYIAPLKANYRPTQKRSQASQPRPMQKGSS